MAKKTNAVNLKGELDLDTMEITETTREGEFTYDFLDVLRDFNGKTISVSIKEEKEIPTKDVE